MHRIALCLLVAAGVAGAAPAKLAFRPARSGDGAVKLATIKFEVGSSEPNGKPSNVVHLASGAAKELAALHDGGATVVNARTAVLMIDYPLANPVETTLKAAGKAFTRAELVAAICDAYGQIYAEEEASSAVKTKPLGERATLQNRNATKGRYGIWGHDLDDLDLFEVEIWKSRDGTILLVLAVES